MKRPTLKRIALILGGSSCWPSPPSASSSLPNGRTSPGCGATRPTASSTSPGTAQGGRAGREHPVPLPVAEASPPTRSPRRSKLAESKNASALLVVHKGRVVLDRHWNGHRPGDQTNSASMAKTVTALLIGIAVGEGKIASIDEPASRWIPAWRDDARSKITLRHLLQMHAGLKPMGEYEEPYSDASYLALGTDSRYVVDNVPAVAEPGRRVRLQQRELPGAGRRARGGDRPALCRLPVGEALEADRRGRRGGVAGPGGWIGPDVRLSLRPARGLGTGRTAPAPRGAMRRQGRSSRGTSSARCSSPRPPSRPMGWASGSPTTSTSAARRRPRSPRPASSTSTAGSSSGSTSIPSRDVVIVRVGENARGWEESALPNAVLRGLSADAAGANQGASSP